MFIILAYDVNQKRVGKVMKICRKYLYHVQKSVFEGNISEKKLNTLKQELKSVIDFDDDTICIYTLDRASDMLKEQIGVYEDSPSII